MNDSFWGNENQPVVLYLFDGPFDADKLTNLSHPWVQFAKESKAKVYGVELRGKGESQIEELVLKIFKHITPFLAILLHLIPNFSL